MYVAWLTGDDLGGFFSAASQVGVGVLIALVLERATKADADEAAAQVVRSLRAGTVALAALGIGAALVGLLFTGTNVTAGAFVVPWGGLGAGVLGLFVFVGEGDSAGGRAVMDAVLRPTAVAGARGGPPAVDADPTGDEAAGDDAGQTGTARPGDPRGDEPPHE